MSVRVKAIVTQVDQLAAPDQTVYQELVTFYDVGSQNPNSVNNWFTSVNSSFSVTIGIANPAAFGTFKQGTQYYVDFTPVPG